MMSALSEVLGKLSHVTPPGQFQNMEVLKCPPNSILVRSCDFKMYDETRLADMLQESCLPEQAQILRLIPESLRCKTARWCLN